MRPESSTVIVRHCFASSRSRGSRSKAARTFCASDSLAKIANQKCLLSSGRSLCCPTSCNAACSPSVSSYCPRASKGVHATNKLTRNRRNITSPPACRSQPPTHHSDETDDAVYSDCCNHSPRMGNNTSWARTGEEGEVPSSRTTQPRTQQSQ